MINNLLNGNVNANANTSAVPTSNEDPKKLFEKLKADITTKEMELVRLKTNLEQAENNVNEIEAQIKTMLGHDDLTKVAETLEQLEAMKEALVKEARVLIEGAY